MKIVSFFLAFIMLFSLVSCTNFKLNEGDESSSDDTQNSSNSSDINTENGDENTDGETASETLKNTDFIDTDKAFENEDSTSAEVESTEKNDTEKPSETQGESELFSDTQTDSQTDSKTETDTGNVTENASENSTENETETDTENKAETDTENKTETDTEIGTESETETEAQKVEIPFVLQGKVLAKIVIPTDASRHVLYARDRIQLSVQNIAGVSLAEEGDYPFEILIGDTGAESAAIKSTLGADEYAIKLVENKIFIVASNEAFLYEAAKYFVDNYLKTPNARVGENEITLLTDDINVKSAGNKASMNYQLTKGTNFTLDSVGVYTLDNQRYGVTDANPRIYRRQGGCFTGEIYYQVLITKNEELAVVARKNVKTGELIYSEPRDMDHANDATYDPYNNRLIVGNSKTVWIYDGDTLEFIDSKTLSHSTARFSYSAERHTYVVGSYYFYDDSLTYTDKYFKSNLGTLYGDLNLSSQGTACDDVFIYSLLIEPIDGVGYNAYVGVFDWYGNTLAFITVNIEQNFEPENVSVVDGKLYIAACSTQPVATVYKVVFS